MIAIFIFSILTPALLIEYIIYYLKDIVKMEKKQAVCNQQQQFKSKEVLIRTTEKRRNEVIIVKDKL